MVLKGEARAGVFTVLSKSLTDSRLKNNPKNFNLYNFGIVIPCTLGDQHHFVFRHRFSAWLRCTSEN